MNTFPEYSHLDLASVHKAVLQRWKETHVFEQTLTARKDAEPWIFFEGPPSANGLPGIHHVMGRSLKDVFCRYKTQKGFLVDRKAGWDTHGLPVELGVEKELGITKEDIGKEGEGIVIEPVVQRAGDPGSGCAASQPCKRQRSVDAAEVFAFEDFHRHGPHDRREAVAEKALRRDHHVEQDQYNCSLSVYFIKL